MYRIFSSVVNKLDRLTLSDLFPFSYRPDERHLQEILPAGSLQEDRRRRSYLTKWEGSRLRHYFPDSQHPPAVYAPIWSAAVRLQRPSLHLRWCARGRQLQGKSPLWNPPRVCAEGYYREHRVLGFTAFMANYYGGRFDKTISRSLNDFDREDNGHVQKE